MAVNMYYSSESSDSENTAESFSLDFSYLMLDTYSLVVHLRNSIREQHIQQKSELQQVVNSPRTSRKRATRRSEDGTGRKGGNEKEDTELDDTLDSIHDTVTQKLLLQHNMLLTLPFEITRFSSLVSLDLSNNNLTHVNDFILQLPQLHSLYLQNNNLADDGLPKDLHTLTKLRELNLSGNKLTRVLPQLCEVVGLRYLYLGGNEITEILPEIKALQSLQMLHLGGNQLETVPDELGELHQLAALILCDNRLRSLPRLISNLTRLRSLLLHKNNLCCLPVCIVKLRGLAELSLRDNPLVTRFVNSCARDIMYNTPSLLELAARVIKLKKLPYTRQDLPQNLVGYLSSGQRCVNPSCKGMYFTSCVEHIKFVDFCGMYRLPLMHYLCSSRCSSKTPDYYRAHSESDSEEDEPAARMKRVLLG